MKFKIYSDIHIGSPIEIIHNGLFISNQTTILLGDIIDIANCEKNKISYYKEIHDELKLIHGKRYISGNHERMTTENETFVIGGIVFAHGDLESNYEKWTEYRKKPHGAGWFKRKFIIPFIREAEEIIERKIKNEFLENAIKLCSKYSSHTYVAGHFHVKELIDINYKGYRIVIVPRGITEIDL